MTTPSAARSFVLIGVEAVLMAVVMVLALLLNVRPYRAIGIGLVAAELIVYFLQVVPANPWLGRPSRPPAKAWSWRLLSWIWIVFVVLALERWWPEK